MNAPQARLVGQIRLSVHKDIPKRAPRPVLSWSATSLPAFFIMS